MRPDREKPIVFSSAVGLDSPTADDHPAADHNLPLEQSTIELLKNIRASKPQIGRITNGPRPMGSDFMSG